MRKKSQPCHKGGYLLAMCAAPVSLTKYQQVIKLELGLNFQNCMTDALLLVHKT